MDKEMSRKTFRRKSGEFLTAKSRRTLFILSFVAWPLVHWLVFYVGTNALSVTMAFKVADKFGVEHWSFDNFVRIVVEGFGGEQPLLAEAVRNTLTFFFFAQLVITPLNWVISNFFFKKIMGYKVFRFVFYLPAVLPGIALQTVFRYVISPESRGVLASLFGQLGWKFPNFARMITNCLKISI